MHHAAKQIPPYAATPQPPSEAKPRTVSLFRNGANQAVRIPKEFELPGKEVLMSQVGNTLVIEPVALKYPKGSPQAFLQGLDEIAKLGPCEDEFPDVDAGMLPLDDIVL